MGQYQLADMSVGSDGSDDRRGHVEAPFESGSTFGDGVVGDEQVGVHGELGQARTFSVGIAAEDDALAGDIDSPCQRGKDAVNDADGVDGHIGIAKDKDGDLGRRDVVRLELVGAVGVWLDHFAEVAPGPMRISEEVVHKLSGRGHVPVSGRAVDGQGAASFPEPGGKDEGGEVAAVIDVEMAEEEDVEGGHAGAALAEAEGAAASGVEDDAGAAVVPDEIAGGGALIAQLGAAGAEDLDGETRGSAGLRGQERRRAQEKSRDDEQGLERECVRAHGRNLGRGNYGRGAKRWQGVVRWSLGFFGFAQDRLCGSKVCGSVEPGYGDLNRMGSRRLHPSTHGPRSRDPGVSTPLRSDGGGALILYLQWGDNYLCRGRRSSGHAHDGPAETG